MIFRNTAAQTASFFTGYVLSFLLAPFMLAQLGLSLFGVWAVAGAFATYAGLVDLGVMRAVERFVALHHERNDARRVDEAMSFGLLMVTVVAVLASLAALALAPVLAHGLDDILSVAHMRVVLLASVGVFVLSAYRGVIQAVPIGMQRMVEPAIASIAQNFVGFGLSMAALFVSDDLRVYALANVVGAAVGLLFSLIMLRAVRRSARIRRPSRSIVREMLRYGTSAQVTWIAELINVQTDKLIIGLVINPRAAGAFEIVNRAVSAVRQIGQLTCAALLPAVTALREREGPGYLRRFYGHYSLRTMSLAMPLLVFAAAGAPAFLVVWLGSDIPDEALGLFIPLTLVNALNIWTGVATSVWLGEGNAGVLARLATISAVTNVALTLALTPLLGLWGVVSATIVTVGGIAIYSMVAFHRTHPVPFSDSLQALVRSALLSALAAAPVAAWMLLVADPGGDRLEGLLLTIASAVVFVAIYWPAASWFGLLPERLRLAIGAGRGAPTPEAT